MLGQVILLDLNISDLCLELKNLFSIFWDLNQQFLSDRYLSLIFRDFNLDHSDLIFHIFYIHFSASQDIFLNIRFLIQDTELIVAIDELNTCQVSILAG